MLDSILSLVNRGIEVRIMRNEHGDYQFKCVEHFGRDYRYEHTQSVCAMQLHHAKQPSEMVGVFLKKTSDNWDEMKLLAKGKEEPMTTHKDSRISALEAVVRELVERGPRHLIGHTNNYSDDVYWQHAKAKALSLLGEMQD